MRFVKRTCRHILLIGFLPAVRHLACSAQPTSQAAPRQPLPDQ